MMKKLSMSTRSHTRRSRLGLPWGQASANFHARLDVGPMDQPADPVAPATPLQSPQPKLPRKRPEQKYHRARRVPHRRSSKSSEGQDRRTAGAEGAGADPAA